MIYFDNAAGMPVSAELAELSARLAVEFHANPESAHAAGKRSATLVRESARRVSECLSGDLEYLEVFFTSSATQAINAAFSFAPLASGTILVSPAAHPALAARILASGANSVKKLKLDSSGGIDSDDLAMKADASVSAVVVEHVQNETGRIQDVELIGEIIRMRCPNALLVVDTVQSAGKLSVPWKSAGINIAFVGGHKTGAPTGGALIQRFPRNSQTVSARFAAHLRELRASHALGRPDPAVCAVLAEALSECARQPVARVRELAAATRAALSALAAELAIDIEFLIPDEQASPYIVSFLLPPFQGEILVRMLSDEGVMISAGSACEAAGGKASEALKSMGVSDEMARTMLRVSFSHQTTLDEINSLPTALRKVVTTY